MSRRQKRVLRTFKWKIQTKDIRINSCISPTGAPSHSSSFLLTRLPQEDSQSSGRVGNRCPDTRFSLMRIRNILIKTYNPPLNPSLQNHLHSLVLLQSAAVTAQFPGPLFCLHSSLHPRLRRPLSPHGVSYI